MADPRIFAGIPDPGSLEALGAAGTLVLVSSFEERAAKRAQWAGRVVALGEEKLTDDRDHSTVDERLALVRVLTREQWAFAGLPIPSYSRDRMPGRVVRAKR